MAVIAALQGNASGEGFLVAPVGAQTFPAVLSLQTDTSTADVTLRASPDAAGLVFSQTSCALSIAPTQDARSPQAWPTPRTSSGSSACRTWRRSAGRASTRSSPTTSHCSPEIRWSGET
jgi:hypothetical protein